MFRKKITGIGLILSLLAGLVAAAAPASPVAADDLAWSSYLLPSTSNNQLTSNTITDITVSGNGKTIYAATGTTTLYKSTDRGVTWTTAMTAGSANADNAYLVATAPDDPNWIVIANTTTGNVVVTTNGGINWYSLGVPSGATVINDIAFSSLLNGVHYVGVVGTQAGAAGVWYFNVGAAATTWTTLHTGGTYATGFTAGIDAGAIAFSPGFSSDQTMAIVTTSAAQVYLQLFSYNSKVWNSNAGYSGYPGPIGPATAGITGFQSTCGLSLDPGYLGSDDSTRLAFVGINLTGNLTNNGLWRMSDTTYKALRTGTAVKLDSVAWNGAVLVAGEWDNNLVMFSTDATSGSPTITNTNTNKRPGYTANTQTNVAWAGTAVVASTKGTDGAFAVSSNNAQSFDDISLINTALTTKDDVAPAYDGTKTYFASNDGTYLSVWRQDTSSSTAWQRVFTTNDTNYIIRVAPANAGVVYIAKRGGTAMYYSGDAGDTRWQIRTVGVNVQDFAVETTGAVLYALQQADGKVSTSTNNGFTWTTPVTTKLGTGDMIASISKGNVLVGSSDGYVSYSTDGNTTWTNITVQIANGSVVCAADGLANNNYIYAATDAANDYIYRWKIGQTDTTWYKIQPTALGSGQGASGMQLHGTVLYVITTDHATSLMFRALNATDSPTVDWSGGAIAAVCDKTPQSLFISVTSIATTLWVIGTGPSSTIQSFTDGLSVAAPAPNLPNTDYNIGINPINGTSYGVTFEWNRPANINITSYSLQIAIDKDFNSVVFDSGPNILSTESPVSVTIGPGSSGSFRFTWLPGSTYFWRVRVETPVTSGWSSPQRVTVAAATTQPPVKVVTPPPTPAKTITLSVPPPMTITIPPAAPAPAPVVPAYMWAIIIIGVGLVIAIIVVIYKTRILP